MNRISLFVALLTITTLCLASLANAQSGTTTRKARVAQADNAVQDADGWVDVLPGGIGAQMRMPIEPKHLTRTMTPTEDTEITLETFLATVRNGELTYVFGHFEMIDFPVGEKAKAARYDEAVQGQVVRVEGEVDSYQKVELQGYEGRDFVYRFSDNKGNNFKIHARLYMRLQSMYEIKVVGLEDSFSDKGAAKFFESFRFSKVNPMPAEAPAENPVAGDAPALGE